MMDKRAIAILTADWHLSHHPPVWRSAEPDWYQAMETPLGEVQNLAYKHNCPILVAGDVFHRWDAPPELLNWFHKTVTPRKSIHAIPGQHDLPHHSLKEYHKSAFCTAAHMGIVYPLLSRQTTRTWEFQKHMMVWSFPFGVPLEMPTSLRSDRLNVALVHDYVWMMGHSYSAASPEREITPQRLQKHAYHGKYYGFDVVVYGDNHKGFLRHIGQTTIFNCGSLIRRRSDEIDYRPWVGLLYNDGAIKPYQLDISKDKYLPPEEAKSKELEEEELDMSQFAQELKKLGASDSDFAEALKLFCVKEAVSEAIRTIIREAIEEYGKPSG